MSVQFVEGNCVSGAVIPCVCLLLSHRHSEGRGTIKQFAVFQLVEVSVGERHYETELLCHFPEGTHKKSLVPKCELVSVFMNTTCHLVVHLSLFSSAEMTFA